MRVVHDDSRAGLLGNLDELREGGQISIHAENAVGDDECRRRWLLSSEQRRKLRGVTVAKDTERGLGQTAGVDQARVAEAIGIDHAFVFSKRLNQSQVRVIASAENERGFRVLESRQTCLELRVRAQGAGGHARRAGAYSVSTKRLRRGFDDFRMGGEAKIIIRREQQDHPAVHPDFRARGRVDDAELSQQ